MIAEALEYQSRAFQIYSLLDQYANSDFLAGILITLAEI